MQIKEIQKYKLRNYRNKTYRSADIQITGLQKLQFQKVESQVNFGIMGELLNYGLTFELRVKF